MLFGSEQTLNLADGFRFMNGVNLGNIFIPESFYADVDFYEKNNIPKHADKYSLCDLTGPNSKKIMEDWISSLIIESEFTEMKEFGINVIRLPLGYWNLIDMPGNPNGPSSEAQRMGHLKDIMKASEYRKYIDQVTQYAKENNIQVFYDLHAAPGSQNGSSHTGCSLEHGDEKGTYWNTDWNKKWTISAFKALAQICKEAGDTCYGIELLNEPSNKISRDDLKKYYHDAIDVAR